MFVLLLLFILHYIKSWSFVHITDLHMDDYELMKNTESLYKKTIKKINSLKKTYDIRFVLITGDLCTFGKQTELDKFYKYSEDFNVPYYPVIGNHDVWSTKFNFTEMHRLGITDIRALPFSRKRLYYDSELYTHGDYRFYNLLGKEVINKNERIYNYVGGNPVYFSAVQNYSYFQNYMFEYGHNIFIILDWIRRDIVDETKTGSLSEGQINSVPGGPGTLEWFEEQLRNISFRTDYKHIFLAQHTPFRTDLTNAYNNEFSKRFGFKEAKLEAIKNVMKDSGIKASKFRGVFAGHLHEYHFWDAFIEDDFFKSYMKEVQTPVLPCFTIVDIDDKGRLDVKVKSAGDDLLAGLYCFYNEVRYEIYIQIAVVVTITMTLMCCIICCGIFWVCFCYYLETHVYEKNRIFIL